MLRDFPSSIDISNTLKLTRTVGLYLKLNTPKGRGVFTSRHITKGQVVDVSPVLIFQESRQRACIQETVLNGYT